MHHLPSCCEITKDSDFNVLYQKYQPMLYRVCYAYLKNTEDTEDAVADTFVKLLMNKQSFQSTEHQKAWLLRTAINICKDRLKHWWNKHEDIDEVLLDTSEDFTTQYELLDTILNLPKRYKSVVYLYYYEGYSSKEISKILKRPQSTVLNHLHEARELLKRVWKDEK